MSTETVEVTLKGTSPLLQHRFSEDAEASLDKATRRVKLQEMTAREAAERTCYRLPNGILYMPTQAPLSAILNVAGNHKMRGSRKSLRYVIPGAVRVTDDTAALFNPDTMEAIKDFEVDSRPITIPSTKGRVMRHRAKIERWQMTFSLRINTGIIGTDDVMKLLVEAGDLCGIGDFRPQCRGPFGCFIVTKMDKLKD
jgi:hypothetical protein